MYKFVVTAAFGIEKMVKTELIRLGYEILSVENGQIEIEGGLFALADLNINLRTADRVFLKIAKFKALTFDELFDGIFRIPWEEYLSEDANFPVISKSVKSALFSKSDIQKISKKAIVKKLSQDYGTEVFKEDGDIYPISVNLLNDEVTVLMDSSGAALNKRGYRKGQNDAPIKETLAAGMVLMSDWKFKKPLIDPFAGSGTLVIEAAMLARNIAPGLLRSFASEKWIFVPGDLFAKARANAKKAIRQDIKLDIRAYDIDPSATALARENARIAGVIEDIKFEVRDVADLSLDDGGGTVVCNPPYGLRLSEQKEAENLYRALGNAVLATDNWSCYAISASEEFESAFGDRADRKRKLFNGGLKCYLYQYEVDKS